MDISQLTVPGAPRRTAVAMRVDCEVRSGPGPSATVCSAACGPVHAIQQRVWAGPDVLLLTRDTAGLAGGDDCGTRIVVCEGASIVISDPGPTSLLPSCDGRTGHQAIDLVVAPHARAVLLPHATVPFSQSRTVSRVRVDVAASGTALVGGVLSPGRVARGEVWQAALFEQRVELYVCGEIVACDALRFGSGVAPVGHLVSLFASYHGAAADLDGVRVVAGRGLGISAVTDDLLVLRAIVDSCAEGYTLLRTVVATLLPDLEAWAWSRIGYAGAGLG